MRIRGCLLYKNSIVFLIFLIFSKSIFGHTPEWKPLIDFEDSSSTLFRIMVDTNPSAIVSENQQIHDSELSTLFDRPLRLETYDLSGTQRILPITQWNFSQFRYFKGPPSIVSMSLDLTFEIPSKSTTASFFRVHLDVDRGYLDQLKVEVFDPMNSYTVSVINPKYFDAFNIPIYEQGPFKTGHVIASLRSKIQAAGPSLEELSTGKRQGKYFLAETSDIHNSQFDKFLSQSQKKALKDLQHVFIAKMIPKSAYQQVTAEKAMRVFSDIYFDSKSGEKVAIVVSLETKSEHQHHFQSLPKTQVFLSYGGHWIEHDPKSCIKSLVPIL